MSDYEPPAEVVEAMAKELHEVGDRAYEADYPYRDASPSWRSMMRAEARFVLRRQHERELALREATRMAVIRAFETRTDCGWSDATLKFRMDAYDAAHAKLDAPKVPTLAECEKRLRDLWAKAQSNKLDGPLSDALDAWKAAVEREEKR